MNRILIDRPFIRRALLFWLILMWPLLVFRGPAYFEDTGSYFKGGAVAIGVVMDRLKPVASPLPPPHLSEGAATQTTKEATIEKSDLVRDAKGVRSIPYSIFSYVLAGPGNRFVLLAAAQALLVAICITTTLLSGNVNSPHRFWAAAVSLALATTVAPFASLAMPDIFAGLTILLLALLMSPSRRYSPPLLFLLLAIAAFAITAHPSHIPLAGAMVLMAALVTVAKAVRGDRAAYAMLYRTAGILATAVAIVVATGVIGFGEVSIAPKRYPFLMARAVEMPPARAYLQASCKTERLEVCDVFPGGLPTSSFEFLWGEHGIDRIATPAQMEALRDEEPKVILAMLRAAPFAIAVAATDGVLRQLVSYDLEGVSYRYDVKTISPIEIMLVQVRPLNIFPIRWSEWLTAASVILSLVAFGLWLRRRNPHFTIAMMLIGGVVANAAVCSILSTVADRYQARVVWILPLAALLLWNGRRALSTPLTPTENEAVAR